MNSWSGYDSSSQLLLGPLTSLDAIIHWHTPIHHFMVFAGRNGARITKF